MNEKKIPGSRPGLVTFEKRFLKAVARKTWICLGDVK